jgi:hypothetical protein
LRRFTTSAVFAVAIAAFLVPPAQAKPQCYSAQDVRAMQLRQVQVELMVGALKCQDPELGLRDKYSTFVYRFNSNISTNAKELRAMFNRLGNGERGLDRYMTELSNDASMRSVHVEDYCGSIGEMFDKALSMKPAELGTWASDTVAKPVAAVSCSAPERTKPVQQAKAKVEPQKAKASPTSDTKVETKKADGKS